MYLNFCNCSAETTAIDSGAEKCLLPFLFPYLHSQTLRQNRTVLRRAALSGPERAPNNAHRGYVGSCISWVAHMKEEARQTVPREAAPLAIFHKTWQAENPDFLLCCTRQTSACHCSSPSGLPTNCDASFSTLPESLTSLTVHLRAHLPSLHSHGNKRIWMGTWWELEKFDGNCLGTWWEQKDIYGLLIGTRGI